MRQWIFGSLPMVFIVFNYLQGLIDPPEESLTHHLSRYNLYALICSF